jgi:hypothetical protein
MEQQIDHKFLWHGSVPQTFEYFKMLLSSADVSAD